jgi:DNA helicase II / ATP-dependent DNA helicase PcrA
MTDVHLIVGPPGTGKSTALATEAEQAGREYGGRDVAIVSLTRTAAAEIAGRTDISPENVGTLHAHAYRALEHPKLAETPEGLRAWADAHPELRLTGGRGNVDDLDPQIIDDSGRTHADDVHQQVMNHRARMTPRDQWTADERDYDRRWEDWKRETSRLDFTDLIETALRDTDQHPAHPRTLLGDEGQDFSTLELALFRKWARHADRAVVAADPDQSIYQWRGADPRAFDRIEDARVLGQSYRVSRAVHELATTWVRQIAGRRDAPYQPRNAAGYATASAITLRTPELLLDSVRFEVERGRTVMILTTCGYMLAPVLAALKQAGVPFHNPLRPERGQWNPLRAGRRLAAFLRADDSVWGDDARLWTWDDLRAFTEPLSARSALARGAKALIDEKCRLDKFGGSQAEQEVPAETLLELFGTADFRHPAFRGDLDWWETNLLASQRDRMSYPLEVCRTQGGRALVETPRVTVGTIHSVKGGEADCVYVAPDLSRAAMWDGWHVGGEPRDHIVRTLYVGLTRARETVTVLSPSGPDHVPLDLIHHTLREESLAA